jgi:CHASE2 domain-containing sensor protein
MIRFSALDAFDRAPLRSFRPKFWHANYMDGTFLDKIVIVGSSAPVEHDVFDTPMSPATSGPSLHLQAMAALSHEIFAALRQRRHGLALVGAAGLIAWSLIAFCAARCFALARLVAIAGAYLGAARLFTIRWAVASYGAGPPL